MNPGQVTNPGTPCGVMVAGQCRQRCFGRDMNTNLFYSAVCGFSRNTSADFACTESCRSTFPFSPNTTVPPSVNNTCQDALDCSCDGSSVNCTDIDICSVNGVVFIDLDDNPVGPDEGCTSDANTGIDNQCIYCNPLESQGGGLCVPTWNTNDAGNDPTCPP